MLVPTLFDTCRSAGLRTAAVQGDHLMHPMLGTDAATWIWPPKGEVPQGTPLDDHGYPINAAVRPSLLEAARDGSLAFLFGHLNEADTVGHDTGPDSQASMACYRATDAVVGEVLDALRPDWADTVVMIVSDHDMEDRTDIPPIDLTADPGVRAVADDILGDGGAALLHLRSGVSPGAAGAAVSRVDGVAGWSQGSREMIVVDAQPGRIFSAWRLRFSRLSRWPGHGADGGAGGRRASPRAGDRAHPRPKATAPGGLGAHHRRSPGPRALPHRRRQPGLIVTPRGRSGRGRGGAPGARVSRRHERRPPRSAAGPGL